MSNATYRQIGEGQATISFRSSFLLIWGVCTIGVVHRVFCKFVCFSVFPQSFAVVYILEGLTGVHNEGMEDVKEDGILMKPTRYQSARLFLSMALEAFAWNASDDLFLKLVRTFFGEVMSLLLVCGAYS